MMLSPESFRESYKNSSLEVCYLVRREIMEELLKYEYNEIPGTNLLADPSPETVYCMNNLYLIQICSLIEEKIAEKREYYEEYTEKMERTSSAIYGDCKK